MTKRKTESQIVALLLRQSEKYWNICWAITASLGHITITVVWPQTKPSADIGLAITMWPKLVDHYMEWILTGEGAPQKDQARRQ